MTVSPWRLNDATALPHSDVRTDGSVWLAARVRCPPDPIIAAVAQQDLQICQPSVGWEALMASAAELIGKVPDLFAIVTSCVEDVHLLAAAPGYDISHSEPQWARRIFVSLPDQICLIGALRLAESVIHEAMHLHLSLYERQVPLVLDGSGAVHSPWRGVPRPYGGVLHGLFVFACLQAFFTQLGPTSQGKSLAHVRSRVIQIQEEIAMVDLEALCRGLTPTGAQLARQWKV